jgi:hypothetical protein
MYASIETMGQGQAKGWQNPAALAYAKFLVQLLGQPTYVNLNPNGVVIWDRHQLKNVKLFGQPCFFNKIMVKDEQVYQPYPKPHNTYVTAVIVVDPTVIDLGLITQLPKIYSGIGYDYQTGQMYIRSYSLETICAIANIILDILTSQTTVNEASLNNALATSIANLYVNVNGQAVLKKDEYKKLYNQVAGKLTLLAGKAVPVTKLPLTATQAATDLQDYKEHLVTGFGDDDNLWGSWATNNPLSLALLEDRESVYYRDDRPTPELLPGVQGASFNDLPSANVWTPPLDRPMAPRRGPRPEFSESKVKQADNQSHKMIAAKANVQASTVADRKEAKLNSGKGQSVEPSIEHLNVHPACRGACAQRVVAQQKADMLRANVERFETSNAGDSQIYFIPGLDETRKNDPRWQIGAADFYYNVGSDVMEIDRKYGTVAQKAVYPKYSDIAGKGITRVPYQPSVDLAKQPVKNFKGEVVN